MHHNTGENTNLLLITYDQWRGDLTNPREPIIKIKSFDKVAQQGWTAEKCYTSSPQCVPARLSWITGLWPSEIGITENKAVDLPPESPSIIRELREKGWVTGIVGKTHWSNHNDPSNIDENKARLTGLGFDQAIEIVGPRALQKIECEITRDWKKQGVYEDHMSDLKKRYGGGRKRESWEVRETVLPNMLYPDIWIAEKAITMLNEMPRNKPWLLWVSFVGPHEPFDTPRPWKGKHKNNKLIKRHQNNGWINRLPDCTSLKTIHNQWKNRLLPDDISKLRKDYADNLALLDDQTSRILDTLEKRQDSTKTAVAITSDHGEMLGDHDLLYKSTFLEGSIRVPFIYRPPLKNQRIENARELKELSLTKLLKITVNNIADGGELGPIQAWSKKQRGAIIEFRNEIMFIQNGMKVAYNSDRQKIWATDTNTDPSESKNILEQKLNRRQKINLVKLDKWAEKQLEKRKAKGWNKLNLEK